MYEGAPMISSPTFGRLALVVVATLAGCSSDSSPDARISTPDAPMVTVDARSADAPAAAADARVADGPRSTPDARPPDAMPAPPDAMAQPDATTAPEAAELIINEVAPGMSDDKDMVELLVVKAGSTRNIQLWQDLTAATEVLATLPTLAVDAGQIIVVHLQNVDVLTEMETRDECGNPACYGDAWDVSGDPAANRSIGYSHRVLYLLDANQAIMDGVAFMRRDGVNGPDAFPADLALLISGGDWKTACAAPCDYDNIENMHAATVNWTGAGSDALGQTIQRKAEGPDTDTIDDWNATPTANSLGDANP